MELSQFDASIVGRELPIDNLAVVVVVRPGGDLLFEGFDIGDAFLQALVAQDAHLDLGDVEPTPVFGRVVDFESLARRRASSGENVL